MSRMGDAARAEIAYQEAKEREREERAERRLQKMEAWIAQLSIEFAAAKPPRRARKTGLFSRAERLDWDVTLHYGGHDDACFFHIVVNQDGSWAYWEGLERRPTKKSLVPFRRSFIKGGLHHVPEEESYEEFRARFQMKLTSLMARG